MVHIQLGISLEHVSAYIIPPTYFIKIPCLAGVVFVTTNEQNVNKLINNTLPVEYAYKHRFIHIKNVIQRQRHFSLQFQSSIIPFNAFLPIAWAIP